MSKKIYGNPVATPINPNKFTGGGGAETDPTVPEWAKHPTKPTYTAQEVGARPNTWLPTIGEIGAAPAGYGLGEGNPRYADDINKAILPGWYSVGEQTANVPAFVGSGYPLWNYSCVFVQRRNSAIWQHLYTEGVYGVGQYLMGVRVSSDAGATWSELEYLNPPMIPGVEYRTTERYNGKPVYVKLIDVGDMPSNDTKTLYHEISIDRPLNIILTAEDAVLNWHPWFDQIRLEKTVLYIVTNNATASEYTGAQCRLKYTKT